MAVINLVRFSTLAASWANLRSQSAVTGSAFGVGGDNFAEGVLDILTVALMASVRDGDSIKIGNAGVAGDGSIDSAGAALTFLA